MSMSMKNVNLNERSAAATAVAAATTVAARVVVAATAVAATMAVTAAPDDRWSYDKVFSMSMNRDDLHENFVSEALT